VRYIREQVLNYIEAQERINWTHHYIENNVEPRERGIRNLQTADQIYRSYFNVSNQPIPGSPEHLTKFWKKQVIPHWQLVSIEREEIRRLIEIALGDRQTHRDHIELAIERLSTLELRERERRYFSVQALRLDEDQFRTYHTAQEILRSRNYDPNHPYVQLRGSDRDHEEDCFVEDILQQGTPIETTGETPTAQASKEQKPETKTQGYPLEASLPYSSHAISGFRAKSLGLLDDLPDKPPPIKPTISWKKQKTLSTWGKPKRPSAEISKTDKEDSKPPTRTTNNQEEEKDEQEDRKPPAKKRG
jgi:hypothetical protein